MSRSLYAVTSENKTPQQHAREAVKRYRKMKPIDQLRLGQATVREGAGMKWMPAWYSFWWNAFVIRPPVGEIQRKLYG